MEISHIETTADMARSTRRFSSSRFIFILSSAAFEKVTEESDCAQELGGGARCCAGLFTFTYVLFNIQHGLSQDLSCICWVPTVTTQALEVKVTIKGGWEYVSGGNGLAVQT